jgi:hypothetical protein
VTAWQLSRAMSIAYRAAHPMDNTSGTIALDKHVIRAHTRIALASLAGEEDAQANAF